MAKIIQHTRLQSKPGFELSTSVSADYDNWLHWLVSDICNLECEYCNSERHAGNNRTAPSIDLQALNRTLQKTGKRFHISFTGGGEPFLVPNIIDVCAELTKRHFVSIITNLTTNKIAEFVDRINPEKVKFVLASAHVEEMERRGLLNRYVDNFLLCREKGFKITACEVAFPPLAGKVPQLRKAFKKFGIELAFEPFCGSYGGKRYPDAYADDGLRVFGLNAEDDLQKFRQRGKLCNAGYNLGLVWPDGTVHPCYQIKKDIGNIYRKIAFRRELILCPFQFCSCPLNSYDPDLFQKALRANPKTGTPVLILWMERIKTALKRFQKRQT